MHIFLTGDLQVGKSTIVRGVAASSGLTCGGFLTFFSADRQAEDRNLYLYGVGEVIDYADDHVVVRFEEGRPMPDAARFDSLGTERLSSAQANAALIIMDECGRLERDAAAFQGAVLAALDGPVPVLGVVRQNAGGWTQQILDHPYVRLITVTEANRDALAASLLEYYKHDRTEEFVWNQS